MLRDMQVLRSRLPLPAAFLLLIEETMTFFGSGDMLHFHRIGLMQLDDGDLVAYSWTMRDLMITPIKTNRAYTIGFILRDPFTLVA